MVILSTISEKTGKNVNQIKELIKNIIENQNLPKLKKNSFGEVEKNFGN